MKMYCLSFLVKAIVSLSTMLFPTLLSRWLTTISLFSPRADDWHATRKPALQLNLENSFHISIFSDLHYGEEENGWGIDQDVNSTRVMNNVLSREKPNFVILS